MGGREGARERGRKRRALNRGTFDSSSPLVRLPPPPTRTHCPGLQTPGLLSLTP